MRTTLHVMSAAEFPDSLGLRRVGTRDGRSGWESTWRCCGQPFPRSRSRAPSLRAGHRVLGTTDRWTVASPIARCRSASCPGRRVAAHEAPAVRLWREPLPEPRESAIRVVRRYLAAYGPATRDDITQFTSFKVRQIVPALEGAADAHRRGGANALRRSRCTARGRTMRCTGALPARVRLDHPRSSRTGADRPARIPRGGLQHAECDDEETFTVDGFVAGAWRVERKQGRWKVDVEPFSPCRRVRREVDAEGERLVAVSTGPRTRRASGRARARRAGRRGRPARSASPAFGQRDRLRLDRLRHQDAAAAGRAGSTRMQSR